MKPPTRQNSSSNEPVTVKVKGVAREIGSGDNTMLTWKL